MLDKHEVYRLFYARRDAGVCWEHDGAAGGARMVLGGRFWAMDELQIGQQPTPLF